MSALRFGLVVLSLALLVLPPAMADVQFEALDELPPGEQYRQLSLMLLVSAAVEPELKSAVLAATADQQQVFRTDDYTTPLARIVNQQSLLAGAAQLFRFTGENQQALRARMADIEQQNPILISLFEPSTVYEDTLLVRTAVANSIAVAGLGEAAVAGLRRYREHTLYLRNRMEYQSFQAELDAITAEAIDAVGGKLDAYQRMFDAETASEGFDRHIQSAESIYRKEEEFDPAAAELTDEMIRALQLLESQPHR